MATHEYLSPETRERFLAEAEAMPAVIAEYAAAVAAFTDLEDEAQLARHDEAATALQMALGRINLAEERHTGFTSAWPESDGSGIDEDDLDDGEYDPVDLSGPAGDLLSLVARVDVRVVDAAVLKEQAMAALVAENELTKDEADQFSDSPLQAVQALLPDLAATLEDAVISFGEVNWVYAGVSAGEFERQEEGFEEILEDEDHRAFYVEVFDSEEEAREAALEAAGGYGGPLDGGDSADGAADGGGGE